ncbi:Omega-hydroxypalmitate O-feruloyl transferase [Dichanthelium oligosanthes]|uniref:Omega-hydroxypalmitate O-feruloyl transferase n=1 Tax=Dichanthelium oligosanthes TaxID=888268 RepID=A0A1E5VHC7_9POAL|nr:Omega-hydroxypalmitate O-feruloyl transferase [Dichanthelium oligosanthes]
MEKEAAPATELEIPGECQYSGEPAVVRPSQPTPRHTLYLSNLDDQRFLRFSIKYLYVFAAPAAVPPDALRSALARVLVDYYPLAGRLRPSDDDEGKLVVDCNAEGALFAEACLPGLTAAEFLRGRARPHKSWRKLLYRVEAQSFVAIPPLVVQVTRLGCGGMVLCTAINHCLCDGIGTAQFLHAWARVARAGHSALDAGNDDDDNNSVLPAPPFHDRRAMRPRCPPRVAFTHPEYNSCGGIGGVANGNGNGNGNGNEAPSLLARLLGQPLAPVSLTFTAAHLLRLKRQCAPPLKCTSFEALAAHVWRAWVRALDPPGALRVKLLFSVNVRRRVKPELPRGYYGNGFVLGCAESTAAQLTSPSSSAARYGVRLVQEAKECVDDDYVRSMVDLLEERRGSRPDLAASLVISAWTRLGLEDLDFGAGTAANMGPLTSEIYCVFLPVIGDPHGVTVLVSVPQAAADRFQHCCLGFLKDTDVDAKLMS